jgi:hypothetical protein
VPTKTANELNDLSNTIIGIGIDIHKNLGPGFQEKIYEEALLKELKNGGIGFEKQADCHIYPLTQPTRQTKKTKETTETRRAKKTTLTGQTILLKFNT